MLVCSAAAVANRVIPRDAVLFFFSKCYILLRQPTVRVLFSFCFLLVFTLVAVSDFVHFFRFFLHRYALLLFVAFLLMRKKEKCLISSEPGKGPTS